MRPSTDNNEGVMLFEEWNNEIKPKQKLQKVWVHVYGVPYEIRSFLSLWALGSILGATQRVDMRSMKKTGVVRLMVAVLDANCIPNDVDIVVDDCLYEIFFRVDQMVSDNSGEPDEFDEDDDLDPENQNKEKDQEMEEADKNLKESTDSGSSLPATNIESNQTSINSAPTAVERQVVEQAMEVAVNRILDELSSTVVSEFVGRDKLLVNNGSSHDDVATVLPSATLD